MALQAAVQRRVRQMGNDVLQGDETSVKRQAGLDAQRHDRGLSIAENDGTTPLLWVHRLILDHHARSPLSHGLLVDPEAPRELRGRSFRSL
jgi:hypothetical protein